MPLVHDFVAGNAALSPDKAALICGEQSLSYQALEAKTNQLSRALIRAGVCRGDRVIIYLPNSIEMGIAVFGVLKAAGVFVPLNSTMKADKIGYIAANCGASAVITNLSGLRILREVVTETPSIRAVLSTDGFDTSCGAISFDSFDRIFTDTDHTAPDARVIDQDLACLIYTSGSTGVPKGVVCGHNNVVFASGAIVDYLGNRPDDIVINVLPFSFDYGLYQLLMVVRFGGTLVIEKSFAYPAAILHTIERERVTGLPVVPTLVVTLLKLDLDTFDLSSLRYITNTAAALPSAHIDALQNRLPHVQIFSMYGMTECKRTLYLPPERLRDKPSSVGVPIPGTEAWIADESGKPLAAGEVGELMVRGSHVMRGYWADKELSSRVFAEGPTPGERTLRTGDLFRADEEGFFYFVGRRDDIIKSRGEKVAPKEVEAVVCELPEVLEAAVIGVPDAVLGEAVKAYVVARSKTIDQHTVRRHCANRLESYMVPQLVEFVDELPKSANGKIDRLALRRNLVDETCPE